MHLSNVLIILLPSLTFFAAASPVAPASSISSQSLVQPRDEAGPHESMIYARKSKSKSSSSNGNSTNTTTSSAFGPVMVGGYAPLVVGMGMAAVLCLNVL